MPQNENPKLRNGLEALSIEHSGKNMILLRDRIGYAKEQLVFSPPAISIIAKMNGINSLRDIQAEFMRETGQLVYMEELNSLIQTLDDHLFLDNEKFRKFAAQEIASFLDSPVRKMYHAGQSYPQDPDECAKMLDSFFRTEEGGPGTPNPVNWPKKKMVGLVAPHIDLNAGGTSFAHAYKAAAESEYPATWIILGTGHDFVDNCFALTVKDFETPLGNIPCDSELCSELLLSADFDLRASEYNHRIEHTIEFQAVFLAFMKQHSRIVPILCSFGHEDWGSCKNFVDSFASKLRKLVLNGNHSVGILASVDLAHVGPRYGDRHIPHQGMIEHNMTSDGELLRMLENCRADDFIERINRDDNSRKICGVAPLYVLAKVLEGRAEGVTLSHSHAIVDDKGSFVTFASMAFYEKNEMSS
jgi:MEMO1 family protein